MRYISRPQPGHYTVSAYRKGPKLPARIWRECMCTVGHGVRHDWTEACDRHPPLSAEVGGRTADPEYVWTWGKPITEAEYARLLVADPAPLSEQPPVF